MPIIFASYHFVFQMSGQAYIARLLDYSPVAALSRSDHQAGQYCCCSPIAARNARNARNSRLNDVVPDVTDNTAPET